MDRQSFRRTCRSSRMVRPSREPWRRRALPPHRLVRPAQLPRRRRSRLAARRGPVPPYRRRHPLADAARAHHVLQSRHSSGSSSSCPNAGGSTWECPPRLAMSRFVAHYGPRSAKRGKVRCVVSARPYDPDPGITGDQVPGVALDQIPPGANTSDKPGAELSTEDSGPPSSPSGYSAIRRLRDLGSRTARRPC